MKIKDLIDINNELDLISQKIASFDTDERKEIKKNNKLIESYILELEEIKDILKDVIKNKYQNLIPKEDKKKNISEEIRIQYENIKFLSNNNYLFKMGIDKIIYEIRYSNNLDIINNSIGEMLDKFLLVGVELKKEDFKYSLSLYKYICAYFELYSDSDFKNKIKNTFDSLYWECPNLVLHIFLAFMLLLEKHKDKFENYIKHKTIQDISYDDGLENLNNLIKNYYDKLLADKYLNYQKFANGELRIEEYLEGSPNKNEIISKFIEYDKYTSLSLEERKRFYNQIKGIYDDLCEYLFIEKYNYIIIKVKEIYQNKNNYVNNYSAFMKKIKTLNKQRERLNKKLMAIYSKINDKSNKMMLKKYNNLFNKLNNTINEIIINYSNYDEVLINNDIINKLNEDSTYYDVFKLFENHYSYLVNTIKDNNGDYEEYQKFLYSPYLNISKSISFTSDLDILNKISSKYELFNININLSDLNKLKDDLEYIIRIGYFDINNFNLDDFKLIFDIKKILETKDM